MKTNEEIKSILLYRLESLTVQSLQQNWTPKQAETETKIKELSFICKSIGITLLEVNKALNRGFNKHIDHVHY